MRRRELYEDEEEPLLENGVPDRPQWDLFKNIPRDDVAQSTAESKYINLSVHILKIVTVAITFLVVLASAVVSKGTMLFMTSQIQANITRLYCNKHLDNRQQYIVTHPIEERTVWIWLLTFAYFVPELGTFIRALRIICFKRWKRPPKLEILLVSVTEICQAIGMALLIFVVFPEMDVIKGAMLTNGVCLMPAIIAFLSRASSETKVEETSPRANLINKILQVPRYVLDICAIGVQGSALVIWPLIEGKPILFVIPVALVLISAGWVGNYFSEKSPNTFIKEMGKNRREFKSDTYFIYVIIAPMKCIIFFCSLLLILWIREGDVEFLFSKFSVAFSDHQFNVTQIEPVVGTSGINYSDAIANIIPHQMETSLWTPINVWIINVIMTYICYAFGKFTCKIMIQSFSFAIPVNLAVPVLLTGLVSMCGLYNRDECAYADVIPPYLFFTTPSLTYLRDFISHQYAWIWLIWLLSQTWITIHIWSNDHEKLLSTEQLFFKPMYDSFLIDQSIAMNRRREHDSLINLVKPHNPEDLSADDDKITRILACATMWHETKEEMATFLQSIMRIDEDQCAHRNVRSYLQYNLKTHYEFETHILFDEAFIRVSQEDTDPHVNQYVLDLVDSISAAASKVHEVNVKIKAPDLYPTPYGGRLVWTLPGRTKLIAHLKDKAKIRNRKRWSQVMYMYYLLGYRIMDNDELTPGEIKNMARNTYILALDGDVDFQPTTVHLLVEYMKKNPGLGAACGRIHPVGTGLMPWYQLFEYAVGHWLQKATEHVIGCVLCSPGCFSLFRAGALMDDNVMATYATEATEALHYVQYDQGEDRWLCTLLLQRGYRVEYSAASDAYTHCPEGFNEFYNQRRRWMPSTTANIMNLLTDYKHIVKVNENISIFYIIYQSVMMIGSIIGPGTIFLMLVGSFVAAFKMSQLYALWLNLLPVLLFTLVCALFNSNIQLLFAGLISSVYGLVMMTVLVGIMIQIEEDGWLAPSSLFLIMTAASFIIAGIIHPQEFYCLKYGILYYITVPSMYMLLVIYSIFNMNNVSWGTREVAVIAAPKKEDKNAKQADAPPKPPENKVLSFFSNLNHNAGSFEISVGGLFKLLCCTFDQKEGEKEILRNIQNSLQQLQQKIDRLEKIKLNGDVPLEPRRTARSTELYVGTRAARASRLSRSRMSTTAQNTQNPELLNDSDADDDDYDDESDISVPSEEVAPNSWFYDGELSNSSVHYLDRKEETFWEKFIGKYLYPLDETGKKEVIAKELKDLRDNVVTTFYMLNSVFVLIIFLLNLQQDKIHINWPISPKVNFTYISDSNEIVVQYTYLLLQPIGFVFLVAFGGVMLVQFVAMFIHRFGTYCQIMANTSINISLLSPKLETITEESLLDKDPVKIFKKLIRLQGINDDDVEEETSVGRRNTAHWLAMKRKEKAKPIIDDLDQAFFKRLSMIKKGNIKDTGVPENTADQIIRRRTELIRRSHLPTFTGAPLLPDEEENPTSTMTFDNPSYLEEASSS